MDGAKCRALKNEFSSTPFDDQMIPIERFFDGNDDLGSIGCNLSKHPGIPAFRVVLVGLTGRSDVTGVYAKISELDPGEGSWPFSDMVVVAGTIPLATLKEAVASLQPDEVGSASDLGVPLSVSDKLGSPLLALWWD